MDDNQGPGLDGSLAEASPAGTEAYVAPALEVLGTVEQITRGPNADADDAPAGGGFTISF